MKGRNSLLLTAAAAVGALVLFPATTALADVAPPTLTGEQFVDPTPTVTTACDVNGTSTISFSSSGVATGPYPGTYTEVGTATLGPQPFDFNGTPHGFLLSFDAVFTIHSTVGDVTGTKSLGPITNPGTQSAVGQCGISQGGDNPVELIDAIAVNSVRYDAEISAPAGEFADHGTIPLVDLQHLTVVNSGFTFFQHFTENFASDLTEVQPLTTPGQATGGGQIPGNVTFGLTAKSDQNGLKGNCTVIDRATNTMVKCLDATTYAQTGTHAVFRGNATVNGVATTYRIAVDDNGEPGGGQDMFTISTASGYSASGTLSQGNIQVHP
jgi:hypothetical protein